MKELGFLTQHEIRIKPTCNKGFIVKIGCATIAASSWEEVVVILDRYFKDPEGWEKKYNDLQKAEVPSGAPEPARPDHPSTAGTVVERG